MLWKRYGVKLIFVQTGRIARFSWNQLLMEIVAGLTLLSVAQMVCDTYAVSTAFPAHSVLTCSLCSIIWLRSSAE